MVISKRLKNMMPGVGRSKKRSTASKKIFATIGQICPKTKLTGGATLPNATRTPVSCKPTVL
jgi:hypothetical protein